MSHLNLDDRIDWPSFYSPYFDRGLSHRLSGDVALKCPFAEHTNKQSFSLNTRTGQWQCFACGTSGNAYDFLKLKDGLDDDAASNKVRAAAGLPPKGDGGDVVPMTRVKMTVAKYAQEKQLDEAFLKELGLRDPQGNGRGMAIPYLDESGIEVATRYRNVATGSTAKFLWKKGSRVHLYGLWRLNDHVAPADRAFIVEGESDCHTMWAHGIHETIGAPGAGTFKAEWAEHLPTDRPVYFIREPGMSGDQFHDTLCKRLAEAGWKGDLREVDLSKHGAKDPSELHLKHADTFEQKLEAAIAAARPVDPIASMLKPEEIVPGFPALRQPGEFRLDAEKGVMAVNKEGIWLPVCPVPVGIQRRLKSVDTGEEKLEVLFRRDGQVHAVTALRSVIASTRSIVALADRGLPVTSENARQLVRYLHALEGENLDTLPLHKSLDRMGWVNAREFMPGVHGDDVTVDADGGSRALAEAYHQAGEPGAWLELAGHVRDNHFAARLMLSAAFAAPLLSKLQQRVFLIHVWGPSRGGKTAALKLALSVWGEPEGLVASFNATKVGLERMAAFYNDLPLGIDEKQVAGDRQGFIESLVYTLGLGKGKVRGGKTGGLQAMQSWRSIVLTTGEEPITAGTSHGGVVSRTVEVYGQPIEGDDALARRLHQETVQHYGHAGPEFIRRLLEHETLAVDWNAMSTEMEATASGNVSSHVASIAVCALADYLAAMWLWQVPQEDAWRDAVAMGHRVLAGLEKAADTDYAERAKEYLEGWLQMHGGKFVEDAPIVFGRFEFDGLRPEQSTCWIIPAAFNECMQQGGFNPRRVLTDFAERGWIHVEDAAGGRRLTVRTRVTGRQARMVGYRLADPEAVLQDAIPTSDPMEVF
ncbi:MAG TPA: DUF927 domain-containing protein [Agromyces sp.]